MAQIRTILAPWSSILAWERNSQWNSNLSYKITLGADHRLLAFDAEVNGRMTGDGPSSATGKHTRLSADWPKSGLLRSVPRQISSLKPRVSFSNSEGRYCTMVWPKNQERITLPSTTSDRQSVQSQTQKCMKIKGVKIGAKMKALTLRHDHFRAKYRYFDDFSSADFHHFPLEDFSQTNRNRLVGAPRAHFRQKLKIDK